MNNDGDKFPKLFPMEEMNKLIDHFFNNPFSSFLDEQHFQVDVYDMGHEVIVEANLTGYDRDQIHIEMVGDALKISAEDVHELETIDENNQYYKKESNTKFLERFIHIPYNINREAIKATYKNNILEVKVPKKT